MKKKPTAKKHLEAMLTDQEITDAFKSGMTMTQLAARTGKSTTFINARLMDAGLKKRPRWAERGHACWRKLNSTERTELRIDLASGEFKSLKKIAEKYGISTEAVRVHAKQIGVTRYQR